MKPASTSPLKNLSEDRQRQVIAWSNTPRNENCIGGYRYAQQMLRADGIKVSEKALSHFYSWWHLRQNFQQLDSRASQFEEMLRRDFPQASAEKIRNFGQNFFTMLATTQNNVQQFIQLEYLRLKKERGVGRIRRR